MSLPLEFCVKDNGLGVPEDMLANLFDPFVTTKPTGSGLGLALGRQDRRGSRRDYRMRIAAAENDLPRAAADVQCHEETKPERCAPGNAIARLTTG